MFKKLGAQMIFGIVSLILAILIVALGLVGYQVTQDIRSLLEKAPSAVDTILPNATHTLPPIQGLIVCDPPPPGSTTFRCLVKPYDPNKHAFTPPVQKEDLKI